MAARKGGKTALVLASGGLTGVAYEVGALRALDHILTNRTVNDFDIYVGTSAGAVVAASLANGMRSTGSMSARRWSGSGEPRPWFAPRSGTSGASGTGCL